MSSRSSTTEPGREAIARPLRYRSLGDFVMDADGLKVTVTKGRGQTRETAEERICAPFELIGRIRDPDGDGWSKLLRWHDDDGRRHEFAVADAMLHGDARSLAAELASQGLHVKRGQAGLLADYLNTVEAPERITRVCRTGWHRIGGTPVFTTGRTTFGAPNGEAVVLEGGHAIPFEISGTLEDWKEGVGTLVQGHSRHVFAVATAFAGPLLELIDMPGGGFHLYGGSSAGKSTAIEAAASVWGRGDTQGFVKTWRATANALEAVAALHSDALLVLDELGVADPRDAAAASYQLSAGVGKGRLLRDGSLRMARTWRTIVLSTGEVRLEDKLREDGRRAMAGQAVRLIDIPADAGRGHGAFTFAGSTGNAKDLADDIKRSAVTAYGSAGPAFVERVLAHEISEIAELVSGVIAAFRQETVPRGADGQVMRVGDRFGLVAAAGELAGRFGIVPWPVGHTKAAAEACFAAWLDARGGTEAHEGREILERVRQFISIHGDARFETMHESRSEGRRPVSNRAGYTQGEGVDRCWYVIPEVWKTEVLKGHDPVASARLLAERGMLQSGRDGFQVVKKVDGVARRFYALNATILGAALTGESHVRASA